MTSYEAAGGAPDVATDQHFQRDMLGQATEKNRKPGALLRLPPATTAVDIDARPLVQ